MLSSAEVQHGAKKFTPVTIFTLSMILLGALSNKFPPQEESVVIGRDFSCGQIPRRNLSARLTPYNNYDNYTGDPVLPSVGLTVVALFLPLMPLVVPVLWLSTKQEQGSREHRSVRGVVGETLDQDLGYFEDQTSSARLELNRVALRFALQLLVGQASCFGSTELARHFILKPDLTFFEKCKLTRSACRSLESLDLLVYRVGGNKTSSQVPQLCKNAGVSDSEIHDSLHSLPNTASAIVGSSLVMFTIGMWMRRRILDFVSKEEVRAERIVLPVKPTARGSVSQTDAGNGERAKPEGGEEVAKDRERNSKIESLLQEMNPYFKIGILVLSLGLFTVLLIDRYGQRRNTAYEIAGSVLCGIVVQCLVNVFYAVKRDSLF
jgi:hypothetical protein